MKLTLKDIESAYSRIQGKIQKTQCDLSRSASQILGTEVFFKHENYQRTGSFKIRGAMNKISLLSEEALKKGIVACSAGNHAQGVAFSATEFGAKSYIVMPESTPLVKSTATSDYGAEVIHHGDIVDESFEKAKQLVEEKGYTLIHPYNDVEVMAGQGTIGLEIIQQLPAVDSVIVPIGGGGLISGIATAMKALKPSLKIYGVVAENVPGMYHLFHGEKGPFEKKPTLADGLAVKQPNQEILEAFIKPLVDDVVMVSEDEIASSLVFLLERAKTVVEGAGATGLAAAIKMKGQWDLGKKCCVLLCGGNIDLNSISKMIEKGLANEGRVARLRLIVPDRPGALRKLTKEIAITNANIIQVHHDRIAPGVNIGETLIEFLLDCKSRDHVEVVIQALKSTGARVYEES